MGWGWGTHNRCSLNYHCDRHDQSLDESGSQRARKIWCYFYNTKLESVGPTSSPSQAGGHVRISRWGWEPSAGDPTTLQTSPLAGEPVKGLASLNVVGSPEDTRAAPIRGEQAVSNQAGDEGRGNSGQGTWSSRKAPYLRAEPLPQR